MPDAHEAVRPEPATQATPAAPAVPPPSRFGWIFPALRVALVLMTGFLVWYIAGHWNRWTGAERFETTNDAYTAGDVTPLAAKVSGYIASVAVGDYQPVRKGDLIAEIEPSDYRAQLVQATANLAAAQAALANLANQKDVQRALIRQAEATIEATDADLLRYNLEAKRQRELLRTRIAGTQQIVDQADAARGQGPRPGPAQAQADQQAALLTALERGGAGWRPGGLGGCPVADGKTRIFPIPASSRPMTAGGQSRCVPASSSAAGHAHHLGRLAAQALGHGEPQGNADDQDPCGAARADHRRRLSRDTADGEVLSWSPGTGSVFALLPPDNATGNFTKVVQRMPVKIALDPEPGPRHADPAGHVG